jgi:fatty-acyl-CoA synthase
VDVPVYPTLPAKQVEYILRDSGAKVLVTSPNCLDVAATAAGDRVHVLVTGGSWEDLRDESLTPLADECEGGDLLYSSGTTGRPKGVEDELRLAPLGSPPGVTGLLADLYGFGGDTVYLSPAPMYHAAPLRFCMAVHRFGGEVVVMERFDPLAALELIEKHRITHTQMVPTMMIRLLKLPEEDRRRFDLSSLRCIVHAAAPCPPPVKEALIDWLGPVVYEYYSSTENYLFTAVTPQEALERPGTVGRALSGIPHVLDDDGNELEVGEVGTIWSEGGLQFSYRNAPEKTAEARNERGWTTVGDIGRVDHEGYLYLTDRKADMIISGGVNVYPQEAENLLVTHPKVADVAVFGIPHEDFGQEVKAVVQPRSMDDAGPELEAELIAFCKEKLAAYKCPRSIDFEAELPRHATGKLYKRLLRDRYEEAARARSVSS